MSADGLAVHEPTVRSEHLGNIIQNNMEIMDGEKVTKSGADSVGSRKKSSSSSHPDCRRNNNARDRRITSSRMNPLQDILFEQHGEYGCHHDLGERGETSSTNDTSVSAEETIVASNDLPDDVQHQALETMTEARHLENAVYQELLVAVQKKENVGEGGMIDSSSHVQEDLINMEAIQDALNSDVDEILSENVSACMVKEDDKGEEAVVSIDHVEDDHDIVTRPGAQYIYPSQSQPSTAEHSQEDDASITYDLFHRPTSPYLAEVIPEAVPVDPDISLHCCVKVNSAPVPLKAMTITSELRNRNTLLRRQSLVDDVISKLQDDSFVNASEDCGESRNVVLLRGDGGIGKSVLCSMVVSNRSTLLHFADGIAWLSLSQVRGEGIRGGMTYVRYVTLIESICKQLDLEVPSFDEPITLPSDGYSVLRQKEHAAMEAAKDAMCRLMSDRHVLIVLDDVWSRSAIPWLNFSNRLDSHLRVLLSTRLRGGFRRAQVIEVGKLSPQEARTLLLREIGCEQTPLTTEEETSALSIANRCLIPVALCIAGRRLSSSNNRYEAFQELANEMSDSDALALQITSHDTMFNLTDQCFAGVSGESLKVSFVAFSVIFTTNERKRSFVSAAAATKVLDALLLPEDRRDLACMDRTVIVLQQLHDLGLLERQGDKFKVRHDSGQEYAKQVMSDKREREILFANRLSSSLGKRLARKCKKNAATLESALHLLCTREYIGKLSSESYWQTVADDEYLFQRLPWHVMSSSHHQSHLLVTKILCSPSFLKRRVAAMDILPCIKAHIHDIEVLDGKSHTKKEKKRYQRTIDTSVDVILDYIANEVVSPHDSGKAFMLLALYFQQHFRFINAMEMYSRAYVKFQREGLEEEVEWVQKRAEKIAFKPICLVKKSALLEDIIRIEDAALLLAQQEDADLDISLSGSVVTGTKLTLSSHPGMALCLSETCHHLPGQDFHDLCIGPTESAVSVKYDGDRFVGCHGGRSCLTAGPSLGGEGDTLNMATYRYCNKKFGRKIDKIYGKTSTSDLIVNEDGSMSPRSNTDLVFATRLPHLSLVKRDSPCRLIFKNGNDLKTNQVLSLSQDCTVSRDKIFSGELLSHPGYAICHDVEINAATNLSGDQMKLCDVNNGTAQFVYDGKKLGAVVDGKCKYFLTNGLGVGEISSNQYLVRDESKAIFKRENEFDLHWICNDDGSLSPANHPTHAIGIHCVSSTELLITEEQRVLAKNAAKRHDRTHRGQSLRHKLRFLRLLL